MDFKNAFLESLCLKPSFLYHQVQNRTPGSLRFRTVGASVSVNVTSHLIRPTDRLRQRTGEKSKQRSGRG
jgi:hypothetical protein